MQLESGWVRGCFFSMANGYWNIVWWMDKKQPHWLTTPFVWWGKKWVIVIGDDFLRWELWLLEDNYTYIRRFRSSWWVLPYQKEPPWIPWFSLAWKVILRPADVAGHRVWRFDTQKNLGKIGKTPILGPVGWGFFAWAMAEVLTFMTLPFLLNLGWIPKEVSFQKCRFFCAFLDSQPLFLDDLCKR